jgi:hypothetical protein
MQRRLSNCDGVSSNGCEVDTSTDVSHCGRCGVACPDVANAAPYCSSGNCTFACIGDFADCDGDPSNGCEVDLSTSVSSCGSCGVPCPDVANAAPSCSGEQCSFTCNLGFGDCDGDPSNGYEADSSTDVLNCDSCGASCPNVANAASSCSRGQCGFTCNLGFGDCDGDPSNGCKVDTSADVSHCGSCTPCPDVANAVSSCSGGQCGFTCNAGFGDCDGDPSNGCETSFTTASHCGICGNFCADKVNGIGTCADSGHCFLACNVGFGNCNGIFDDGCEADFTSVQSCGRCRPQCPSDMLWRTMWNDMKRRVEPRTATTVQVMDVRRISVATTATVVVVSVHALL